MGKHERRRCERHDRDHRSYFGAGLVAPPRPPPITFPVDPPLRKDSFSGCGWSAAVPFGVSFRHRLEHWLNGHIRIRSLSGLHLLENRVKEPDEFTGLHCQRSPDRLAVLDGWQPPASILSEIGIDQGSVGSKKQTRQRVRAAVPQPEFAQYQVKPVSANTRIRFPAR